MLLNYWVKSSLVFKPTAPLTAVPTIADFVAQPEAVQFLATNCVGKVTTPTGDSFDVLTGFTHTGELIYGICYRFVKFFCADDLEKTVSILRIREVANALASFEKVKNAAQNHNLMLLTNAINFDYLYFEGALNLKPQNFNCHLYKVAILEKVKHWQEFENATHFFCLIGAKDLITIFPETVVSNHPQLSLMPIIEIAITI